MKSKEIYDLHTAILAKTRTNVRLYFIKRAHPSTLKKDFGQTRLFTKVKSSAS